MRLERTKNARRNTVFGIIQRMYQMLVPFVMRTVMIYTLGVEYLGLNSLFTSVLQVLNLTELGVGAALVFSMYKPIAEDDDETICALMNLYKLYYRIIGLLILVIGLCLLPFIPSLIHGSVPSDVNVYILYLMNLLATVLTYWLFSYKNSLLQAFQRQDLATKVMIATDTIKYIIQFAALLLMHDYYWYVIAILVSQILQNIGKSLVVDRLFSKYKAEGKLPKEQVRDINQRVLDLFTTKVGNVIVVSSGSIVISSFLGLAALAIYQNYFYLITAVAAIFTVVFQSVMAGIGNSLILESAEKNYRNFEKFSMLISWLATICACCFLNLFQPFMVIWVGDKLLLDFTTVVFFCVYFYVYEIDQLFSAHKDSAGIWHQDRFRPLITACANLALSILLVHFCGVLGVLLGMIISTIIISMPWILHNMFTFIYEKQYMFSYIRQIIGYFVLAIIISAASYAVCSVVPLRGIGEIVVKLVLCLVVSNILIVLTYRFFPAFVSCVGLIDSVSKGKIPFLRAWVIRKRNGKKHARRS
ncbi:lipopolysaccharide biosynthesis protein [Bifidobacterium tissieri]|uniref:lipopolysaccharide biosynthesis protein n=1 Tax=Bifidobacterium tissieri TaxID=1630162 RepID=UPI00123A4BCD|nr:oligosaccharide flippase family protein [Bifidobacterium tissieri]KAA8831324.1 polysaccharide biosynthesis protein [Bifidobacterium tissieri]